MEEPINLKSLIYPEKDKDIKSFDKHSEYLVKVLSPFDLVNSLLEYSDYYYEAAHLITDFILNSEHPSISKLDTYFFSIAFLYRHSLELGLKAIGFQYIRCDEERECFINETKHNLLSILDYILNIESVSKNKAEILWLKKYFMDMSKIDKDSDSFRYPFHIIWESDISYQQGRFIVQSIFDEQTHIDLIKFANKFEAAYEIIKRWYDKDLESAEEWKVLSTDFIEIGGYYYSQSVVAYGFDKNKFYPYIHAYLETANFLKWYMKNNCDSDGVIPKNHLFLPMCYLYKNCLELNLKAVLFEDTDKNFNDKCKIMMDRKHSIIGIWKEIKPYVEICAEASNEPEYIEVIEDYCNQIHNLDSDSSKFRYPMSNNLKPYFSRNTRFDFMNVGDYFEALNNVLDGIDSQLKYINDFKTELEAEYSDY